MGLDLRRSGGRPARMFKNTRIEIVRFLVAIFRATCELVAIQSLPSSVGKLHNLRVLNLVQAMKFLSSLPDEIGNDLVSLEI